MPDGKGWDGVKLLASATGIVLLALVAVSMIGERVESAPSAATMYLSCVASTLVTMRASGWVASSIASNDVEVGQLAPSQSATPRTRVGTQHGGVVRQAIWRDRWGPRRGSFVGRRAERANRVYPERRVNHPRTIEPRSGTP